MLFIFFLYFLFSVTNVDFILFMQAAQMMINTKLAHWKICSELYRAKACVFLWECILCLTGDFD